jgi:hypothetical protein
LRACRDIEREVFAAIDPTARDAPGADGGWSPKDNLGCYDAWGGRLDEAWSLLRQALPAEEDLRRHAPTDDDLIALRPELETLAVR